MNVCFCRSPSGCWRVVMSLISEKRRADMALSGSSKAHTISNLLSLAITFFYLVFQLAQRSSCIPSQIYFMQLSFHSLRGRKTGGKIGFRAYRGNIVGAATVASDWWMDFLPIAFLGNWKCRSCCFNLSAVHWIHDCAEEKLWIARVAGYVFGAVKAFAEKLLMKFSGKNQNWKFKILLNISPMATNDLALTLRTQIKFLINKSFRNAFIASRHPRFSNFLSFPFENFVVDDSPKAWNKTQSTGKN